MVGCARSPANTSINHSDETWGGEKFLALRAATVVRKATKTMALTEGDDPLSFLSIHVYIYIFLSPSVLFFSFLPFPFFPSSFVPWLFFFLFSLSRARPIFDSRFDRREEN